MPVAELDPFSNRGIRSYALRRVNPFLGVLQVIETPGGRAVSANGVVWDIEVIAERSSNGWGSLNQGVSEVAYYRYGLWSQEDGLVNRPLTPHLDSDPLTRQCHLIIDAIRDHLEHLPFSLEDSLELWLFDSDNAIPLALLASVIPGAPRPKPEPKYWSSSIGASGLSSQRRFPQADELEARVKKRAGFNVNKYWIQRQHDSSGVVEADSSRICADVFPPFLLSENWSEAEDRQRAMAYHDWIAPSLLTLQHLQHSERQRLEKSLSLQAVSIEHHWHLYPEIIDESQLNAARVQGRLQNASQTEQQQGS